MKISNILRGMTLRKVLENWKLDKKNVEGHKKETSPNFGKFKNTESLIYHVVSETKERKKLPQWRNYRPSI